MSSELKIIAEEEQLLVVEKPPGLPACPRSPKIQEPNTLEGWVQQKFPEARLVHRLDNDSSGLMVAAKNEAAWEKLHAIWNSSQVKKIYTLLVAGHPQQSGIINEPIAHHPRKKKKMQIGGKNARPAETKYHVVKKFQKFSLVEAQIQTGVRHQIRVHFAFLGHPIFGDVLYEKVPSHSKRMFLHLSHIILNDPFVNKMHRWRSPLPKDLQKILDKLAQ